MVRQNELRKIYLANQYNTRRERALDIVVND